jgi:hypothetical protein
MHRTCTNKTDEALERSRSFPHQWQLIDLCREPSSNYNQTAPIPTGPFINLVSRKSRQPKNWAQFHIHNPFSLDPGFPRKRFFRVFLWSAFEAFSTNKSWLRLGRHTRVATLASLRKDLHICPWKFKTAPCGAETSTGRFLRKDLPSLGSSCCRILTQRSFTILLL